MAFLPQFLPGYGAVTVASLVVSGAAEVQGRTTSAGYTSSILGDATTPAYNWTAALAFNDAGLWATATSDRIEIGSNATAIVRVDSLGPSLVGNVSVPAGTFTVSGGDLIMGTGRAVVLDAGSITDCAWQYAGDPNSGGYHSGVADRHELAAGGVDVWSVRTSLAHAYVPFTAASTATVGTNLMITAGYIEMTEIAAPGAGAADKVRIYPVVDGGSKTDLAAIFQSGAAQVFAQEP